eukprot:tig00000857_g4957.t1
MGAACSFPPAHASRPSASAGAQRRRSSARSQSGTSLEPRRLGDVSFKSVRSAGHGERTPRAGASEVWPWGEKEGAVRSASAAGASFRPRVGSIVSASSSVFTPRGAETPRATRPGSASKAQLQRPKSFGSLTQDEMQGHAASLERDIQIVAEQIESFEQFLAKYAQGDYEPDKAPAKPRDFAGPFLEAPKPREERRRLHKLRQYDILDTTDEESSAPFDRIVQFCAALFELPICLVSLVENERQWFKARCGLEATETGRDVSFCSHVVNRKGVEPLVVEDALADWRFAENPLVVGPPHIRFYAGAPLVTSEGLKLGTLCCIDKVARDFGEASRQRLCDLADMVMRELEHFATQRRAAMATRFAEAVSRFALDAIRLPGEAEVYDLAARTVHAMLKLDERSGVTVVAAAPAPPAERQYVAPGAGGAERGGEAAAEDAEREWLVQSVLVGKQRRVWAGSGAEERAGVALESGSVRDHLAMAMAEGRAGIPVDVMEPEDPPMPPGAAEAGACSGFLVPVRSAGDRAAAAGFLGAFLTRNHEALPDEAQALMPCAQTLSFLALLAAALVGVVEQQRAKAALQQREEALRWRSQLSDALLRSILPESLISPLLARDGPIARAIPAATILFCDIVGTPGPRPRPWRLAIFTRLSSALPAPHVVETLNTLFGVFDRLCAHFRVEKIKTIGDAFMAASGVPEPREDHAAAAVELAEAMFSALDHYNELHPGSPPLALRMGMHSGPVVGGVIGDSKLQYDVFGDTVNVASRMESNGVAGRIQVSAATHALVADRFRWERREEALLVKGKDEPIVCFLFAGRLEGGPGPTDVRPFFAQALERHGSILQMCGADLDVQGAALRGSFTLPATSAYLARTPCLSPR